MRFHLNSGQTSAVKTRRGLGADSVVPPKSPREYGRIRGKSYGGPTEVLRKSYGSPTEQYRGTTVTARGQPAQDRGAAAGIAGGAKQELSELKGGDIECSRKPKGVLKGSDTPVLRRTGSLCWRGSGAVERIRPMPVLALTIFTGAFLLFQVQPLIGKYILPWLGGGPGVWTTCMLFFQALLERNPQLLELCRRGQPYYEPAAAARLEPGPPKP